MNHELRSRTQADPSRAQPGTRVLLRDATLAVGLALLALVPRPGIGVALAVLVVALVVGTGAGGIRRGALTLGAMAVFQASAVVLDALGGPVALPLAELPFALARAGVPWLVAVAWTQQAQIRRSARLTAAQHERQRHIDGERERQNGRMALAEGLHDDLGHALSLVALNLGALEVRRNLAPEVVAQVRTAREQVGTAVERLGVSVASLRTGTGRPAPGAAVGVLLDGARRSGMTVTLEGADLVAGDGSGFCGVLGARVLQEALTNAAKHAPGQPVRVVVETEAGDLLLTVSNPRSRQDGGPSGTGTGTGAGKGTGSGTGLGALAREVARHDGMVSWDDRADAFVLSARVPRVSSAESPTTPPGEEGITPVFDLASAAHRRGVMVLVGAAAVIALALAAVELTTRGLG
ncbi:histidine kinase [Sanguibacter sp. 4.1]|uniref:histidine kinase n=1 Tax=Sanguibacter biliveldensis TaxID=3030830 RepID=A0AAF1C1H3_9MICO|nr:histidine kinase [Sanguibacter sp. 4.1]WPF80704.1 histidine kinase [Sanguibacter sp. 4.1]